MDSNLKLRIIAPQRHFLLASPSYLAQHGTPKQLSDLPLHQGLFYRGQLGVLHWRFGKQGKQIEAQPMLISNNANSLIETAVNGGGLLMMPDWAVHHELRNGTLVQRIDASGYHIRLEVDGGVKVNNIADIARAGADMFVAGSAIFDQPDYKAVIDQMRVELAGK